MVQFFCFTFKHPVYLNIFENSIISRIHIKSDGFISNGERDMTEKLYVLRRFGSLATA